VFLDKLQKLLCVPFGTKHVGHTVDVPKVFGGFAFPIKLELPQNNIFRRGEVNWVPSEFGKVPAGDCPSVEGVKAGEIDVCLEAGLMVNEVEMTPLSTGLFDLENLARRTVELVLRKGGLETEDILRAEVNNNIYVVRHARLAVIDGRNTACDHVPETQVIELPSENQKGLKRRHAGRFL